MSSSSDNMKIDFVLPWLDGNDPVWLAQKDEALKQFQLHKKTGDDANTDCRYREMGLLRYWFRAVETYAPWVNKVFLVTCGQKPEWLNVNHPKLVQVDHKDFIPAEYLPTFNSITIENNLHRIPELSEHFVLFNDDFFLLRPVLPEDFFRKGNPVIPCNMNICRYYGNNHWSKVCANVYCTVNNYHDIKKAIWDNRRKWFSISALGASTALKNCVRYMINKTFSINGFDHLAYAHLKSTMDEVWSVCPDILDASCRSRFRSDIQVNHWLFMAWNLVKGRFFPVREGKRGRMIRLNSETIYDVKDIIERQRMSQLCINDSFDNENPEYLFREIANTFSRILPEKSGFEL